MSPQRSPLQADPSRFNLIVQMVEVGAAAAHLALHPHLSDEECEEQWESIVRSTRAIGQRWAEEDVTESLCGLPKSLCLVVEEAPRVWAERVCDAFYDGYFSMQRQRCVFPKPRRKDARPPHILAENDHFWLAAEAGSLEVVSKNVSGGFGTVNIPPAILAQVFQTVERREELTIRDWYRHDPYGMESPRPRLLRDDQVSGWDEESPLYWKPDSETLGELSLSLDHPGRGEIYFGAPAQEAQQLASFLALQDRAQAWLAQSQTPECRQEAEQRAKRINAMAAVSFLCSSGFCHRCDADVTLLLTHLDAQSHLTGCPGCGATWCD